MIHTSGVRSLAVVLPVAFVAACAGTTQRSESVRQVDDLLTQIERVQAESAVARETTHAALDQLCALVSPGFHGEPVQAYDAFVAAVERAEEQADTLRAAARPMHDAAQDHFQTWTADLESFGNSKMRQRSQTRLDESRARYQTIETATQAAQISLDGFLSDLQDHALFLGNDLNATAVASIRGDVRDLVTAVREVDKRLDGTSAAARAYVESAALYGQMDVAQEAAPPPAAQSTPEQQKRRSVTTLKPRATTAPPPEPTPAPSADEPAPTPAPQPEPTPAPDCGR